MGNYTPEQTSTLFLAVFFLTVMAGLCGIVTAAWRLWAPAKKRQMEALSLKHEADARLSESLVLTTARQTDLTERLVDMSNDHSQTLDVHGRILNVHTEQLQNIAKAVDARIVRNAPGSQFVTMAPAVEVGADGQTRPVVVATEVIHRQEAQK